jgi:hypothetical protein
VAQAAEHAFEQASRVGIVIDEQASHGFTRTVQTLCRPQKHVDS